MKNIVTILSISLICMGSISQASAEEMRLESKGAGGEIMISDSDIDKVKIKLNNAIAKYGKEHYEVADAMTEVARAFKKKGNIFQSGIYYKKAFLLADNLFGEHDPRILPYAENYGDSLMRREKYFKAREYFRKCYEIYKKYIPDDINSMARLLYKEALIYHQTNDLYLAEKYYRKALDLVVKSEGIESIEMVMIMAGLAESHKLKQEYAKSEALYKTCLQIISKILPQEDPRFASILHNLGYVYFLQGKVELAEPLMYEAQLLIEMYHGAGHVNSITVQNNIQNLEYMKKIKRY